MTSLVFRGGIHAHLTTEWMTFSGEFFVSVNQLVLSIKFFSSPGFPLKCYLTWSPISFWVDSQCVMVTFGVKGEGSGGACWWQEECCVYSKFLDPWREVRWFQRFELGAVAVIPGLLHGIGTHTIPPCLLDHGR